jgi:hypothetical protein
MVGFCIHDDDTLALIRNLKTIGISSNWWRISRSKEFYRERQEI